MLLNKFNYNYFAVKIPYCYWFKLMRCLFDFLVKQVLEFSVAKVLCAVLVLFFSKTNAGVDVGIVFVSYFLLFALNNIKVNMVTMMKQSILWNLKNTQFVLKPKKQQKFKNYKKKFEALKFAMRLLRKRLNLINRPWNDKKDKLTLKLKSYKILPAIKTINYKKSVVIHEKVLEYAIYYSNGENWKNSVYRPC